MREDKDKNLYYIQKSGLAGLCLSMLFLLGLSFLNPSVSSAQEYGIWFVGKPASKDNRTKLDLNPEGYYSFHDKFELSFSMRLHANTPSTFGYVARIIDSENKNIDIIYNGPGSNSLQVIYGQELTNISLPDNFPDIYHNWKKIRLKIDLKNQILRFSTPDTTLVDSNIEFNGKVKFLFGANDFAPFKTTDVPAMNLRDIRIYQKGKCLHHFPLDESSGNMAIDLLSKKKASVQYPIWIKPEYHDWDDLFWTVLSGFAAITYDPREEKVYMIGDKQMKIVNPIIDTNATTLRYNTRFTELQPGSQAFFDTINDRLICYNLRLKTVHYFNRQSFTWEKHSEGSRSDTALWSHNKYYSGPDSILYIFGGYGQHKYYNLVQRYDFVNLRWDTLQTSGDKFHPRRLAASGNYGDTIFILGGFGSISGDQILKPQHYTDLMAFSLKDKKFIKKYEFQAPLEDIDFANSMVIDKDDQSYYVLASSIFEYESYLQLLKGNLDDSLLIMLGNKIPYIFHNENSYSDLYFSETHQKLIAVRSLTNPDRSETEFNLHTISFPPHVSEIETSELDASKRNLDWRILLILGLASLTILIVWYYRRKRTKPDISEPDPENKGSEDGQPIHYAIPGENGSKSQNSILFFGGFQIINKDGEDITTKFTRLLKELFLLIFLNSVKDKGISIQRMTELLWFSMDEKSAKNNRAVNIAKLKNLIAEIEGCSLSRKTGYWQIVFNDSIVYNDYWSCIKIINQQELISKEHLEQFLSITKMGPLLGNSSYEWLDEYKSDCSNLIIDTFMRYIDQSKQEVDPDLIIRVADAILIFDILHEEAISYKCKALIALGKHSLAKNVFTKFSKEYTELYGEQYDKSFTAIIKSEDHS